jgi:hypothetical protein
MINLEVDQTVGYMLKVMKHGILITKYKEEFAAIRHGNYDDFIELVGGNRPPMVVYHNGSFSNQDSISQKTHFDFAGLALAQPSLKIFFHKCVDEYGKELLNNDSDISNSVYKKIALFEPSLRMHANNNKLLNEREELVDVIKKLGDLKNLLPDEIEKLQKGRQFLNDIKHHAKPKYKRKFSTWQGGALTFESAYKVIENNQLTIV